ncbi:Ger(x)C family spore germination protein [Paenibacillus puerhi]|uniref:Ger(x)C family spore germination protein n=1 Tax=Paenibacillus puerhi TaxID=2692622 RepID=UPI001358321A|nr:Ger(x)C family spore germination protein [Paenibacillus puerhi]
MLNKVLALAGVCLGASLLLTGCWDRLELNDRAIILGWGMDLAEDGVYLATANIVLPLSGKQGSEHGGGGQSGKTGFLTESAYGKDNSDAAQNMQKKLSRIIFPGHRRNIFIGEKLAKAGVASVLDEYSRNPTVRPRTNIFVVKGSTAQQAMSLSYQLESNPSTAVQKIQEKVGAPISRSLLDFYMMANTGSCGVMPALEISHPEKKYKVEKPTDNPPKTTLELTGAAIFTQQMKLAGYLGPDEFWVRLWLLGKLRYRAFTYAMSGSRETVTVNVNSFKSRIVPVLDGHTVSFKVLLEGKGFIVENDSALDLTKRKDMEAVQDRISRYLERQTRKTLNKVQKSYKCDIFGFGDSIHRRHPYQWKELKQEWAKLFPSADISVEVKLTLTSIGITGKSLLPSPEKGEFR